MASSNHEEEFSLKSYLVPFTTSKAIHFLVIIGLIVYFNSLFNGFVGDDFGQLVDNEIVHSIKNIPQFFVGGTFNNGNGAITGIYYRPLLLTTYSFLYSVYEANSFGYHLFQVLLHICNSTLIFILFKKLFRKELAFFLSLIFLVHPINTEAVVYIACLQDTLFVFFGLLATCLMVFKQHKIINIFLINLFLLLAFLSKETGIAFTFIILSYCYLFDRKKLKTYLISLTTLVLFYVLLHVSVVGVGFSDNQPFPMMRLSLQERVFNIPLITVHYIKTFFFPTDLATGYQWAVKSFTFYQFYLPLCIVLLFGAAVGVWLYHARKNVQNLKKITFFTIWFLVGMLLHIQVIPLDFTVADRWFYLPIIGLLGLLGLIFNKVKVQNKFIKLLLFLLCCLLLILLSFRTIVRNGDWKDGITLAEHDIKYASESYSLENYLGVEYYNKGRYAEAQKHFTRSTELAPYWDLNWNYLGLVLERTGTLQGNNKLINEAKEKYKIAIKNSILNDTPFVSMARLLVYSADPEAKNFIKKALIRYPSSSGLWYYSAILNYSSNDKQKALEDARRAYLSNPYNQEAKVLYEALLLGTPINIEINK